MSATSTSKPSCAGRKEKVQEEKDQPKNEDAPEAAPEETPAEAAPEEAPAADEAEPAEPTEKLSPRARRKRARATAVSEQRPQRTPTERAQERAEQRAQKATARGRWRAKRREKGRAAAATAAPAPARTARAPGVRKTQQGVVVSSKGDKTITVRIDRVGRHRVYGKVVRQSSTLHAHDERNEAGEGDVVRVIESRPLSRTKRWRLVQVLEKAR
jgi:small subunit ribosomal protein S17